jgi:hypothetical protein
MAIKRNIDHEGHYSMVDRHEESSLMTVNI